MSPVDRLAFSFMAPARGWPEEPVSQNPRLISNTGNARFPVPTHDPVTPAQPPRGQHTRAPCHRSPPSLRRARWARYSAAENVCRVDDAVRSVRCSAPANELLLAFRFELQTSPPYYFLTRVALFEYSMTHLRFCVPGLHVITVMICKLCRGGVFRVRIWEMGNRDRVFTQRQLFS